MPDSPILIPNAGWDERILVCRFGALVDVFLIVTERYVVLLDTLINAETAAALLDIAWPHLSGRRLLVVNTHSHYDHAWGNQVFGGTGAAFPSPIIGTRRCAALLRAAASADDLAARAADEPEVYGEVRLIPPDVTFDGELTIDGGDLTLQLLPTPGHAPDQIAVWIPEIRALFPADAAELPFPLVNDAATLPELRGSLAKLAALDAQTALYCHAPTSAGPRVMGENIAYFDAMERACRSALSAGVAAQPAAGEDAAALVGFSFDSAIPPGVTVEQTGFYAPYHQRAVRAMLAWAASAPAQ